MKLRIIQMMKYTAVLALLACLATSIGFAQVDPGARSMMLNNNGQAAARSNRSNGRLDLTDPLGLLRRHVASQRPETEVPDPVKSGLAKKKTYTFSTADYPGGDFSVLIDANASTAVGYFAFSVKNLDFTAFTLTGNSYKILAIPGSTLSQAFAINTSGQIVGGFTDAGGVNHGFLDTAGSIATVDFPGSTGTSVYDVNDSGQIVGSYIDSASNEHGFLENGGLFTSIDYPGAPDTIALGINTAGAIVGSWVDVGNSIHSFLFSGGVFTTIEFPFSSGTEVFGINDSGEISGSYIDAANATHGFIYSNGAWSSVDVGGATDTALSHIKNNGNIIGTYVDDTTEQHGIKGH
jgi:probable HAF family extracellular repeat protein